MSFAETALLGLQGLLGVAMATVGGGKLAGRESFVEDFDRFGYPQWFRVLTGGLEFLAALGLLVAFVATDILALAAAILAAIVLLGAIATHMKVGDSVSEALPATVLLVLALIVSWSHAGALP